MNIHKNSNHELFYCLENAIDALLYNGKRSNQSKEPVKSSADVCRENNTSILRRARQKSLIFVFLSVKLSDKQVHQGQ
jgi:hypothetical protein